MSKPFNNSALATLARRISDMVGEEAMPERLVVSIDDSAVELDFDSCYDQDRCLDVAESLLGTIETLTGGLSAENALAVMGIMLASTAARYAVVDENPVERPVFPNVDPEAGFDQATILATVAVGLGMCAVVANRNLPEYEDSSGEDTMFSDTDNTDDTDNIDNTDDEDDDDKQIGENPFDFTGGVDVTDAPPERKPSGGLEHGSSVTGKVGDTENRLRGAHSEIRPDDGDEVPFDQMSEDDLLRGLEDMIQHRKDADDNDLGNG